MRAYPSNSQRGFTIIELMVAIVVSLLTATAIYAIFIQSEGQQRRSSETADVWQQARIAMTLIERDVRMAGYGMNPGGCSQILAYDSRLPGAGVAVSYPIQSVPQTSPTYSYIKTDNSGNSLTSALTIKYANGNFSGMPTTTVNSAPANTAAELSVDNVNGINLGDILLLRMSNGVCAQIQATGPKSTQPNNVVHNSGSSCPGPGGGNIDCYYNSPQGIAALGNATNPPQTITVNDINNSTVYNMGQGDNTRTYFINPNSGSDNIPTLMVSVTSSLNATVNTQPVARGIVALQILYGLDTNQDGIVDTYAPWSAGIIPQIRTARIALLARAGLPDKNFTSPASIVLLPALGGNPAQIYPVPVSEQQYRHQLFVTEIPLRNLIWQSS